MHDCAGRTMPLSAIDLVKMSSRMAIRGRLLGRHGRLYLLGISGSKRPGSRGAPAPSTATRCTRRRAGSGCPRSGPSGCATRRRRRDRSRWPGRRSGRGAAFAAATEPDEPLLDDEAPRRRRARRERQGEAEHTERAAERWRRRGRRGRGRHGTPVLMGEVPGLVGQVVMEGITVLHGIHPFTAPAVRPRMRWRCRKMSSTRMGIAASSAAARPMFLWSMVRAASERDRSGSSPSGPR